MTDADVLDLAAYVMSLEPVVHGNTPHDLPAWQFSWMMAGWNMMAGFLEGEAPAVGDDPLVQRGAYLARALGHCGECHTPRNALGMMQLSQEFTGAEGVAPDISRAGLSTWTTEDFTGLLQLGMTASFDFVGGEMAEVIEHTSKLTPEDQDAYTAFFMRDTE